MRRLLLLLTAALLVAAPQAGATLRAPRLDLPADAASVEAAPLMTWHPVAHAASYEIQVAADQAFGSTVDRLRTATTNTAMSLEVTLPDGTYWWRVRAIAADKGAGRWSAPRSFRKQWDLAPALGTPAAGGSFAWPLNPLVLTWAPVPYAAKYLVSIGTDPSLAQLVAEATERGGPIETEGTSIAIPFGLPAGEYFWAVQPVDADGHRGATSEVRSFTWGWNATTTPRVVDGNDRPEVFDPILTWDAVPGAAKYDVQVNTEQGFGTASTFFSATVTGTSVAPLKALPNNNKYFWRVRAVDPDGQAGPWQVGPSFLKSFDDPDPAKPGDTTIENLHVRTHDQASVPLGTPVSDPILAWDPVPGAASYEVFVAQQMKPNPGDSSTWYCDWSSPGIADTPLPYLDVALVRRATTTSPWPSTWPRPGWFAVSHAELPAGSYCVRVLARDGAGNDSIATQLGSDQQTGLQVQAPPGASWDCTTQGELQPAGAEMTAADYLEPAAGAVVTRTPMFTWNAVSGAKSYWIVVARDASFTDIVDYALVDRPVYVPRIAYADEEQNLYWAVIASPEPDGSCAPTTPATLASRARTFDKLSAPPALLAPAGDADTPIQPVFRWSTAEGAAAYHVQIALDREFRDVIDDQVTASTAYAASATYPVDTQLYWRVMPIVCHDVFLPTGPCPRLELRGTDVTDLRTFRRTLPVPVPDASNPTSGGMLPVFSWQPVDGAISYDVHIDQVDGTTKDFTTRAPRMSFTEWYGTGIWSWKVRANFPSLSPTVTASSAYSAPMTFLRHLDPPADTRVDQGPHRLAISWTPDPAATSYEAQISDTDSFVRVLETVKTKSTNWAPSLTNPAFGDGGRLFWRVRVLDSRSQPGAWRSGTFDLPRGLHLQVTGLLLRHRVSKVAIVVTNRGRAVRGATVTARGAGVHAHAKTNRSGKATMRLRVRRGGRVQFRASRKSYASGTVVVAVFGS